MKAVFLSFRTHLAELQKMVKNQSSERVDLILKELVQAYPRIVDV